MRAFSVGLATCLVAAVAVGCGTVPASHSGSAAHTAAAARAENPGKTPGVPTAEPTSTGPARAEVPSGCQSPAPAGPTVKTIVITLAGNEKTYCVRVGDKLSVYLRGTDTNPWLRPLVSSNELVPIPNPAGTLARGVTGASFAAVRPGRVLITSVRPPCQVAIPLGKGDLEPAFAVPRAYPLRFCAPGHRFSASIIVLRYGRLPGYLAAIAAAICGSGSGHAAGCMDITYPIPRPGRGGTTTAGQIMA